MKEVTLKLNVYEAGYLYTTVNDIVERTAHHPHSISFRAIVEKIKDQYLSQIDWDDVEEFRKQSEIEQALGIAPPSKENMKGGDKS